MRTRPCANQKKLSTRLSLTAATALVGLAACAADPKPSVRDAGSGDVGSEAGGMPVNACAVPDPTLKDRNAAELFGATTIPAFDFYLPAADWEALQANARAEEYVPAQACFEGKAIGIVGLRFKGSYGSLYNCFDSAGVNT